MKRFLKPFVSLAILALALSLFRLPAQASDFTSHADTLNRMGLFLGTGNGYELDRAPFRSEAAVMLVRLLGREADAQSGAYRHPFQDVPAWADPYVGYLYANGLTKGTSGVTFSPSVTCDLSMYTVFVLRALGYTEEEGDFTYAGAVQTAQELGLLDETDFNSFLRDDLVALSYSALFQPQKGGNVTKLEQLIAGGAVSEEAGGASLDAYKLYLEYAAVCETASIDVSSSIRTVTDTDMTIAGQTIHYGMQSDTRTVITGGGIELYSVDSISDERETSSSLTYYADGFLYTSQDEGASWDKTPLELEISDYIASTAQLPAPFYLLNSITKTISGTDTVYTLEYSDGAYGSLLDMELASLGDVLDPGSLRFDSLREVVTFGPDGALKAQAVTGSLTAGMTEQGVVFPLTAELSVDLNVLETGSSVTITAPDHLP